MSTTTELQNWFEALEPMGLIASGCAPELDGSTAKHEYHKDA